MAECPHSTMAASADARWGNTRVADDDDVTENNSSDTADDFIILMGALGFGVRAVERFPLFLDGF